MRIPDLSKIPDPEYIPLAEDTNNIRAILEEERAARIAAEAKAEKQFAENRAWQIVSIVVAVIAAVFSALSYFK